MDKPAAFSTEYADWKVLKTRSCIQIVFEIPLEAAVHVHNVLGGMPNFSQPKRFAIARLNEDEKK